jgi:hypothetical protein
MNKLKTKLLNKLYGGENLVHYKRSYHHPLISKRFHNIDHGFCYVTKVWNIKERSTCCSGFNYEKDDKISWSWKIEIKTDLGYYILKMSYFISKSTNADGSKIDDKGIYIFYR